jgi:phosphoesterase RecJ-like protein
VGKVNYSKIEQIISENEKIFISTHINPDGDSLGSAFAMYHYLKKIGKDCRIINHSEVPLVYSFLNEKEIFNEINDENIAFIKNADLGIILDIGDFYRLGEVANVIEGTTIETINIDHHPLTENNFFTHNFINLDASSVGEILYSYFSSLGSDIIDKEMMLGIYSAVLTDTGSFRFSNTNQLSHEIAVDAIKMGINISEIYQNIYENSSVSRIKLLGNVIQKLNFDCNGELLWFSLNNDMVKEVDGTNQDFDGFTDFFRGIQGVEIALMLYDLKGKVRLSFRSKGKYKVNNVAKKMGGGGHPFAAAALVDGEFSDVKSTVLGLLSTYINNYDEDTSS